MLETVPGLQQETRRRNILSRFGCDKALNISAYFLMFLSRYFDMIRNVIPDSIFVKIFFEFGRKNVGPEHGSGSDIAWLNILLIDRD
jgi:hypothetical protein